MMVGVTIKPLDEMIEMVVNKISGTRVKLMIEIVLDGCSFECDDIVKVGFLCVKNSSF